MVKKAALVAFGRACAAAVGPHALVTDEYKGAWEWWAVACDMYNWWICSRLCTLGGQKSCVFVGGDGKLHVKA